MSRDSLAAQATMKHAPEATGSSTKLMILGGIAVLLVALLAWAWWPASAPTIDPAAQKALDAMKNDKDANPPVPDVPPPTDGPRRKALKGK